MNILWEKKDDKRRRILSVFIFINARQKHCHISIIEVEGRGSHVTNHDMVEGKSC